MFIREVYLAKGSAVRRTPGAYTAARNPHDPSGDRSSTMWRTFSMLSNVFIQHASFSPKRRTPIRLHWTKKRKRTDATSTLLWRKMNKNHFSTTNENIPYLLVYLYESKGGLGRGARRSASPQPPTPPPPARSNLVKKRWPRMAAANFASQVSPLIDKFLDPLLGRYIQ